MIALNTKPGVDNTDANYPFGKIVDGTGGGTGTPVSAQVYQDIHQTMSRLMFEAGLTPNGLPDNNANGYQIVQAITTLIANGVSASVNPITAAWSTSLAGVTSAGPGISGTGSTTRIKLVGKTMHVRIRYINFTFTGSVASTDFNMVAGAGYTWLTGSQGMTMQAAVLNGTVPCLVTLKATDLGMTLKRADGTNFAASTGNTMDVVFTAEIN